MIEIYWGGKLYRFESEEQARAAGFHLEAPKDVPVVEPPRPRRLGAPYA